MSEEQISAETAVEAAVGRALRALGWSLATAESCTGGLIGHRITQVPGSSEYFLGGIVSYSDAIKRDLLGVSAATLAASGAVSEATALEMALGVRRRLSADVGLSVTGIAGPGGGSQAKPVGLTWVAVASPRAERARRHVFKGDRGENKAQAAEAALRLLLEEIGDG